ncbi:MAG: hypothetical protein R3F11_07355 [Verrucomicrobiales bacterium]
MDVPLQITGLVLLFLGWYFLKQARNPKTLRRIYQDRFDPVNRGNINRNKWLDERLKNVFRGVGVFCIVVGIFLVIPRAEQLRELRKREASGPAHDGRTSAGLRL